MASRPCRKNCRFDKSILFILFVALCVAKIYYNAASLKSHQENIAMISFVKILATCFAFLLVLFFIGTTLTITSQLPIGLTGAVSVVAAFLAGWFSWRLISGQPTAKSLAILGGALIVGGIFFTLVFLGSMAVIKDTSQGPMIGIFIAAPLGILLGALGGYQYATKFAISDSQNDK